MSTRFSLRAETCERRGGERNPLTTRLPVCIVVGLTCGGFVMAVASACRLRHGAARGATSRSLTTKDLEGSILPRFMNRGLIEAARSGIALRQSTTQRVSERLHPLRPPGRRYACGAPEASGPVSGHDALLDRGTTAAILKESTPSCYNSIVHGSRVRRGHSGLADVTASLKILRSMDAALKHPTAAGCTVPRCTLRARHDWIS